MKRNDSAVRQSCHLVGRMLPLALALLATGCKWFSDSDTATPKAAEKTPPNILFVIMDDVGIDQVAALGYGGLFNETVPLPGGGLDTVPDMPSINAIAEQGVRFRNTWSMPECSPGRSALMTGRYPLRNNIYQAIGPNDLANSQVDPFEVTVSRLLKHAGYESGMFGKFHLAGPENNQAGNGTPRQLGWDHFHGWTGGLPGSIDTTAGGVAPAGSYSCGFVPKPLDAGDTTHGAAFGACYVPTADSASCEEIHAGPHDDAAGLQCLVRGGVLVPRASCQAVPPAHLVFDRENGHYVSPLVVNSSAGVEVAALRDVRGRGYRSSIEVDAAIDWIRSRPAGKPWMATLSFSAAHTPLQPPPRQLLPSGIADELGADCSLAMSNPGQRRISDAMIEAMDVELGRLLQETGIATRREDGSLLYNGDSNTVIVIVGDNGSFANSVKLPFDLTRSKGSAYQTGVWVPLIVAGPMVANPDRDVEALTNATDVFRLFGEIAGLDVAALTPRGIDGQPLLPYLTDPAQAPLRRFNFTQGGLNLQANGGRNGPCAIGNSCSHTPISKGVCEDNGGTWWGAGANPDVRDQIESAKAKNGRIEITDGGLRQCWQVNQVIYQNSANYAADRRVMGWTDYKAVRDERYKLVSNKALDYDIASDSGVEVASLEFYEVDQAVPTPLTDTADRDLLSGGGPDALSPEQKTHYDALLAEMERILASQQACPGDGNGDGVVDWQDFAHYYATVFTAGWGGSSTYDFNHDGVTDGADLAIINANLGACP